MTKVIKTVAVKLEDDGFEIEVKPDEDDGEGANPLYVITQYDNRVELTVDMIRSLVDVISDFHPPMATPVFPIIKTKYITSPEV